MFPARFLPLEKQLKNRELLFPYHIFQKKSIYLLDKRTRVCYHNPVMNISKTTTKRKVLAEARKQLEIVNPDTAHFLESCRETIRKETEKNGFLSRAAISNGVYASRLDDIRIGLTEERTFVEGGDKSIYELTLYLSKGFFECGCLAGKSEPYQSYAVIPFNKFGERLENAREFAKRAELHGEDPEYAAWLFGRMLCKAVDRVQNAAMGVELKG